MNGEQETKPEMEIPMDVTTEEGGGPGAENAAMEVDGERNEEEVGENAVEGRAETETAGEEMKCEAEEINGEGEIDMRADEPNLSSEEQELEEHQTENEIPQETFHDATETAGSALRIEITQAPEVEETVQMETDEQVAEDSAYEQAPIVHELEGTHLQDSHQDARENNSAKHVGAEVRGPPYHNPLGLPQAAAPTTVKTPSPKRPVRVTRPPSPQKPKKEPAVKAKEGGKDTHEKTKGKGRNLSAPLMSQTLIVKLKGEQTGRMVIPVQKNKRGKGAGVDYSEEDTDDGGFGGHDSEETEEDESSSKVKAERKSQKRTPGPTLIGPDGRQLRRKKPKKDPAKPKRPLPPFMYYSKAMRKSYITSNPNKSLVEITQLIGESWAALPEAQKQFYYDMSMRDKKRYTTEMTNFKKTENFPCGVCSRQVGDGEKAIMCEFGCQNWFHQSCSGLTEETYKLVAHEPMAAWMCNNCYAERKTKRKSPRPKAAVSGDVEAPVEPAEE